MTLYELKLPTRRRSVRLGRSRSAGARRTFAPADALLRLRINQLDIGTVVLKTSGDAEKVLAWDRFVFEQAPKHWLVREVLNLQKRVLKRLDVIEDHKDRPSRASPHVIPRQVPGDLKHPRALVAVCVVLGAKRPKKRLLGQVFGGLDVAEQAPEEPVHRLTESGEETLDEVAMHPGSC